MFDSLRNQSLTEWVKQVVELCQPSRVHLCDGSEREWDTLTAELEKNGTFIQLNETKRPNSFLARTTADDVARVEDRTFICSRRKEDAGPTNNWVNPEEMKKKLLRLFKGCMRGRTLYVVPFSMGPLGSDFSQIGVEITDSAYVVCNMKLMTRMGTPALDVLEEDSFVPCLHSVGRPLAVDEKDVPWPCNTSETHIVHFPEEKSIWSYGSGYGGNALLGKKSLALRIASVMGKEQGWFAEHMLVLGITNPEGKKKYFAAAFPSACGKTNLAMLRSTLPGWKVETVGDDIAWMKFDAEGRLWAINPEAGFFGVAPGTSLKSNPYAIATCNKNTIFTNVALTPDGDVWWEGMTKEIPSGLITWQGVPWKSGMVAAHPNSRFTAPASQCPVIDPLWEDPRGVPIEAIIFGGRRATMAPLVVESYGWNHGVFMGANLASETTAATTGAVGKLRHDPFAMLPFCGYNMGDYFGHWLEIGEGKVKRPLIYSVNWFQKDKEGNFIWPGYGENIRVLKWIFERIEGKATGIKTPLGTLPAPGSLDVSGLQLTQGVLSELFHVDRAKWLKEVEETREYLYQFKPRLPQALEEELSHLEQRLRSE